MVDLKKNLTINDMADAYECLIVERENEARATTEYRKRMRAKAALEKERKEALGG